MAPPPEVKWVVFSGSGARQSEATRSAEDFLRGAGRKAVSVHDFRDGFFPYHGSRIKEVFESLKKEIDPDVVFTHNAADAHQDHRLVNELTWNTFRDHLILEYEIPKYDGDLGRPNVYVPLDEASRQEKISLLEDAFPSQSEKPWYGAETFSAMLRLRGIECRAPAGYAEAFYARKIVVG